MASATAAARLQDWPGPSANAPAAANAARSAADWARCRPITAAPTAAAPVTSPMSTTIRATANTVAEPRSARARLGCRHRLRPHRDTGQQRRGRTDPRDDPPAVAPHLDRGTVGSRATGRFDGGAVVSARREPGRFAGRIDATHLHRDRGQPTDTEDGDRDECGDRERRLDRDAATVIPSW